MFCQICEKNYHKYKCPNCLLKYCSIGCFKDHAKKCAKSINKPENYVSLSSYNEKQFKKDFNYLSTLFEKTNEIKKKLSFLSKNRDRLRFKLLKIYARRFYSADFDTVPFCMSRHLENISFVLTKNKSIFWNVEILFFKEIVNESIDLQNEFIRFLVEPIDSISTVGDILKRLNFNTEYFINKYQDNISGDTLINMIQKNDLILLIKNDYKVGDLKNDIKGRPPYYSEPFCLEILDSGAFVEVSCKQTLASALTYLKFLEFPTLFLIPKLMLEPFLLKYIALQIRNLVMIEIQSAMFLVRLDIIIGLANKIILQNIKKNRSNQILSFNFVHTHFFFQYNPNLMTCFINSFNFG